MTLARFLAIALAAPAALGGCGGAVIDDTERTLVVSGAPDAVVQFIGEQRERDPALQSFAIDSAPGGEAHGRIALPRDYDGDDIGRITQAAVAAGLSYEIGQGAVE